MAKHLNTHCAMLLLAMLGAGRACAENLPDPTRPPAELAAPAGGDAAVPAGPVLQSVQISPASRSAIISGQRVVQGGRYGDARVVKISESEVVLKSGGEIQTLKLFPGVEKRVPEKAKGRNTQRKAGQ